MSEKLVVGYAILLQRPGFPDKLTDNHIRDRATALHEARAWNLNTSAGTATAVQLRKLPPR